MVLQVASTMVISRLLTPAEVGVFAIAAVFSGLASMFRDFGVAEYMIQERDLTTDKISAAFALNIVVSWAMAAAMYFSAGPVAAFYGHEGVGQVMHVQALGFVLVPFGAVTMAWFRREMNLEPVLICNAAGSVTAFITAVGLAFLGFGYLSMPWAAVASIAVTVLLSVMYRPRGFPRLPNFRGIGPVFHFSKYVTSIWMVGQAGKGAPELIIGRVAGTVEVAMFSRANGLVEMFNRLVMRSVSVVGMPYLAQSDRAEGSVAAAYVRSVSYMTAVGWTFFAFLAIAAFSAIRVVYGSQWDAAVPLARVLCLAGALDIVHSLARDALLVRGRAREGNRLQLIVVVLQVCGLLLVVPFGLTGAAWGVVASTALTLAATQRFLSRGIGLRLRDLVKGCLPSLYLSAFAVAPAAAWSFWMGVGEQNFLTFGIAGSVVTAACWLVGVHLVRHPVAAELLPMRRRLSGWLRRA